MTIEQHLNPWFTNQELEEVRKYYTTLPTDDEGDTMEVVYGNLKIRSDVTKLIAEIKRLKSLIHTIDHELKWGDAENAIAKCNELIRKKVLEEEGVNS